MVEQLQPTVVPQTVNNSSIETPQAQSITPQQDGQAVNNNGVGAMSAMGGDDAAKSQQAAAQ